jgi:hypothetical protein
MSPLRVKQAVEELAPAMDQTAIQTAITDKPAFRTNIGAMADTNAAVNAAIELDVVASRKSLALNTDRLQNYRAAISANGGEPPRIVVFGDSMVGTNTTAIKSQIATTFGISGYSLSPTNSGGASVITTDTTKWITGILGRMTASGHTLTLTNTSYAVAGDKLKLYYITQPGGGTFKLVSNKNGATTGGDLGDGWLNESGYDAVSTDGTLGAAVITITKSDYNAVWKLRVKWVSGGTVDIIGGEIYNSRTYGARLHFYSNNSVDTNNIDMAAGISSAIINPIFGDLKPHLIIHSNLDGETMNNSSLPTLIDNINAGVVSGGGLTPGWVLIGPPAGQTPVQDILNEAQANAMRTIAETKDAAFFDNREWMLPQSTAIAKGYLNSTSDPHVSAKAADFYLPKLFNDFGLGQTTDIGQATIKSLRFAGVAGYEFKSVLGAPWLEGGLTLANKPGETGQAILLLEDFAGSSSSTDFGIISYSGDALNLGTTSSNRFSIYNNTGVFIFTGTGSSTATPVGWAGHSTAPLQGVTTSSLSAGYVEKTSAYTLTHLDYVVNVTGSNDVTITLPASATVGGPLARNKGMIYIIKNSTTANTVTVARTSNQLINGVAADLTLASGEAVRVISTGSAWVTIP